MLASGPESLTGRQRLEMRRTNSENCFEPSLNNCCFFGFYLVQTSVIRLRCWSFTFPFGLEVCVPRQGRTLIAVCME
jgi:hypothetical protein